jgi:hypothetical protein
MKLLRLYAAGAVALLVAACGVRTGTSVTPTPGATPSSANADTKLPAKSPNQVMLTESDITDRPYQSLGDIKVDLQKWGAFDKDPTHEMVAEALKKKAAEMGADAVVLVRYGTLGIGLFTWGEMDGQGRAVVFKQ